MSTDLPYLKGQEVIHQGKEILRFHEYHGDPETAETCNCTSVWGTTLLTCYLTDLAPYKVVPLAVYDRRVTELLQANTEEKNRRSEVVESLRNTQKALDIHKDEFRALLAASEWMRDDPAVKDKLVLGQRILRDGLPLIKEALDTLRTEVGQLRKKTGVMLGVGDGAGQKFVYGDYESIKAAQDIIFRLEEATKRIRELETTLQQERDEARVRAERFEQ
jgi:hypothetical protein